jgi:4-amino-4-deoxy-L-arabinose transferase-like glycosyltransferase
MSKPDSLKHVLLPSRVLLLKRTCSDARLNRLNSTPPIRSRAPEEGDFQIPFWGIPLILILLYVCLFSGLGVLGLVGPDEPRYAAIARAMADTHDWVTPRLWGTPWFEKPVLYYWLAGIAMRIFGVGEFAARLPSALAALLAVAAIKWAALRSYGLGAAWFSLLMLPASVAMIGFSRAAGPDMLFAGLLTAAMAVACEMLQKPRPGPILRIAFGFFLGAAVLAKGPAAIILAGGATLMWAAIYRQWRAPFRFLHPLIIVVFCATALPWYVLCALRNPDFLRVFIWQHNFQRYLTPVFEHRQPFWFFGYILLLAVFPWILFLGAALFGAISRLKDRAAPESIDAFFACWALFPVLFFSLSQSKLPGYILPAIPPLFILLGQWVSSAMALKTKSVLRALGWTGGLFLLAVIPLATAIVRGVNKMPPGYVPVESVVFLIGIVIVALVLKSRPREALLFVALFATVTVAIANFDVLPGLNNQFSARPLAVKILKTDPSGGNVAVYRLPRAWEYGMNFYMNRDLPEWAPGSADPEWILGGRLLPAGMLHSTYEFYLDESGKFVVYHRM